MTMNDKMTSKGPGQWGNNPNTQTLKASTENSHKNITPQLFGNAKNSVGGGYAMMNENSNEFPTPKAAIEKDNPQLVSRVGNDLSRARSGYQKATNSQEIT